MVNLWQFYFLLFLIVRQYFYIFIFPRKFPFLRHFNAFVSFNNFKKYLYVPSNLACLFIIFILLKILNYTYVLIIVK